MDPERWKQVDAILQSAMDRAPEELDEFLRDACAGDEALENEVRSLLKLERARGRIPAASGDRSGGSSAGPRRAPVQGSGSSSDRFDGFSFPHCRKVGRRRNGRGVQSRRHPPGAVCRSQVSAGRRGSRPGGAESVPARSASGIGFESPQYLHDLRHRRARRSFVHRDGVSGGRHAEGAHSCRRQGAP